MQGKTNVSDHHAVAAPVGEAHVAEFESLAGRARRRDTWAKEMACFSPLLIGARARGSPGQGIDALGNLSFSPLLIGGRARGDLGCPTRRQSRCVSVPFS